MFESNSKYKYFVENILKLKKHCVYINNDLTIIYIEIRLVISHLLQTFLCQSTLECCIEVLLYIYLLINFQHTVSVLEWDQYC